MTGVQTCALPIHHMPQYYSRRVNGFACQDMAHDRLIAEGDGVAPFFPGSDVADDEVVQQLVTEI